MRNQKILAAVLFVVSAISAQSFAEEKHDHKAPHGGELLEAGEEAAHVELVHDEKAGKITLYILGSDAKTALPVKDAPKLNLKTDKGGKQLETKAVDSKDGAASQYEVTDEALKADPLKGRIVLLVNGKKYNIEIAEHDHKK